MIQLEEVTPKTSMRILYNVPFVPWPLRVRSYNLIPRLAERHAVYLLCLSWSGEEDERSEVWANVCRDVRCVRHHKARAIWQCARALATPTPLRMAYFASRPMQEAVRQAVADFAPDVIYTERWRALQYIPAGIRVPVLCDPTDSMFLYNQRLAQSGRWWERPVAWEESRKFRAYEAKLAQRADAVVFCSRVDQQAVEQFAPDARYVLAPNGVDGELFFPKGPQEEEPNTLVCTGNLRYGPNRHALRFLLDKVMPFVRHKLPSARLIVAGNGSRAYLGREIDSTPGLEVVDFVPELRPYIARAAVAVAPIVVGAGVCNKVGEAFATGTAVVATRLACGDLPVEDGVHLLLADHAEPFAEKVIRLLRDTQLRAALAKEGRRLIEQKYDWTIVSAIIERALLNLACSKADSDTMLEMRTASR